MSHISPPTDIALLLERVHELERRQRALLLLCIPGLVAVAGCVTAALRPSENVLRAQRLVIVDEQGNERAAFECKGTPNVRGYVGLTIVDREGSPSIFLGVVEAQDDGSPAMEPNAREQDVALPRKGGSAAFFGIECPGTASEDRSGVAHLVADRHGARLDIGSGDRSSVFVQANDHHTGIDIDAGRPGANEDADEDPDPVIRLGLDGGAGSLDIRRNDEKRERVARFP